MNEETCNVSADAQPVSSHRDHILFPNNPVHAHAGLLARFLTELSYEDIPEDVVHKAKLLTLDTIGCIVAGTDTVLGRKILAAYGSRDQERGCTVLGTSLRMAPSLAGKVNAWLSDVLDYEDVAVGHPSATIIPAALALSEHTNATPKRFLAGVIAGYEAGLRLHDATQASPEAYQRFAVYHAWHGVAAGAAAMVIAGGSEEQFRSALGHAAANTCLPLWYVQYGQPAHALKANYGQMALAGIDAALCARHDIIGPFAMLSDLERGFARIIGSDRFNASLLSTDLCHSWRTRESSLKAFPCCAFLHTTIEAVSNLVEPNSLNHKDIDKILIRTISRIPEWFSNIKPSSDIDAQLSVQYVSAMTILSVGVGREWYSQSMMENADVHTLMEKIEVEIDPIAEEAFWKIDQHMSSVTIMLSDGRSLETSVQWPRGHWRRPFSDADVKGKFLRNVRGTALESKGAEIFKRVMDMENYSSMRELTGLLSITD
ncbi:2-methylcitrate dehydratase PrpD [Paraburkholderia sp. RAU2J]|uniref:MmgE/PrpD family protein n=1 Tax=Paraburkholderia sp. RAU2J TaxID=1938810 RepID=UPI000F0F43D6|nr:MmgE/PrpD family protein [Paraburkholderia sp. RAU2J]RKT10790.1 2-methylcitrate dehydratase PrpD [Paraburkholderia sp. RAU2J]